MEEQAYTLLSAIRRGEANQLPERDRWLSAPQTIRRSPSPNWHCYKPSA